MKTCSTCGLLKPLSCFPYQENRGSHLSKCVECKRDYDRAYWSLTKERRNSRKKQNTSSVRERNTRYLLAFFKANPCTICGESDPLVLEFDHLEPTTKEANVSELLGTSLARIDLEISKCRVLVLGTSCRMFESCHSDQSRVNPEPQQGLTAGKTALQWGHKLMGNCCPCKADLRVRIPLIPQRQLGKTSTMAG